ncbi:hypothetical protein L2E82_44951 [Cichorium intybus]|uniref:Uncharacterized protein n=1 Tax=Cichorium intybus TaxID=13427 RepID=A0ACB8ZRN1_CICIN|nr:hypothetical protein L2E82_44951 [Cichorium intybus]
MPRLKAPINQLVSRAFLVYSIPTIEMAFRRNHPFLQFPDILESLVEYTQRRDALIARRILDATILGRDILIEAGLWAEIEPFLHHTWSAGEFTFTCRGWDRLMANQDDIVYTELLLEFLSTVHYAPALQEVRSSLGQPAWDANAVIWAALSNVHFEGGSAKESQLRNPLHRLMHRIISTSVMQKHGGEKVSGEDMTYIWVLLDPTRFLHLLYALEISLSTRAAGVSASRPLAGRHYITCLDRSYGLLTAATIDTLTTIPPLHTSARAFENMHLIHQPQEGRYVRVATEAPRAPRPAHAQEERPPRRRQRVATPPDPPAQPQQEETTALRRLEGRVARIEDQLEWIGEVLLEMASQQGRHPRPFPARAHDHEAGPSRPPGTIDVLFFTFGIYVPYL